jgi:UDP-N-acetylmuramoyl-tripeptide--D-alanyl-D-alanine ligase
VRLGITSLGVRWEFAASMPVIVSDPVAVPDHVRDEPREVLSLTPAELAAVTSGTVLRAGGRPIRGAAVDSRRIAPGQLFVALPGERTDGHDHVAAAVAAGATGVLVTRSLDPSVLVSLGDVAVVRVADGLAALEALASAWRRRFHPVVVGVTGSVAKSSTKEAIATLVALHHTTLKSEGNENNEIGLPLTLLRLGPEHEVAVLEMGMYVPGEIARLSRMARPSIGVVTAVRPIHLSRAGSIEAIEAGKGELVEALPPEGVAVLNADDERVTRMAARTRARTVTYGFATDADVRAEEITSRALEGMAFTIVARGERHAVRLPRLGRHAVHNALAAAAVALEMGSSPADVAAGLSRPWSLPHRSAVIRLDGVTVIDDAYNAGPDSMIGALDALADLPGRHVAVLGRMAELGELEEAAHVEVGRRAGSVLDLLVAVGEETAPLVAGARAAGLPAERIVRVPDPAAAVAALSGLLRPGDVVLVKASRSEELERVVEGLQVLENAGGFGATTR